MSAIQRHLRLKVHTSVLVICAASACSKDTDPAPQSVPIVIAPPPPAPASVDCPHTGKWAECSVERRLRQAGFVAKKIESDTTKFAGFSIKPIIYQLGKSRAQIFIYEDSVASARDRAQVDTTQVTLVRSANLVAIFIGDNPRQAERFALALTAGAPQPGSPR